MTRGSTELWQARPDRAKWLELAALPVGAMVEFVDDWDIFDAGVIPAGTLAKIEEQGLNELQPALILKPVDAEGRIVMSPFLDYWDGEIWLYPDGRLNDPYFHKADESTPAPVKIVNPLAAR